MSSVVDHVDDHFHIGSLSHRVSLDRFFDTLKDRLYSLITKLMPALVDILKDSWCNLLDCAPLPLSP